MAKLVEEKVGEEKKRAAARDIISSAIRTGLFRLLMLIHAWHAFYIGESTYILKVKLVFLNY